MIFGRCWKGQNPCPARKYIFQALVSTSLNRTGYRLPMAAGFLVPATPLRTTRPSN
ncbi:MAG: hypothetical protein K6U04_02365 [Armatimonadetes bacterium]|nr:hypothetical protein [Armatimonadota bacterium]